MRINIIFDKSQQLSSQVIYQSGPKYLKEE